MVDSRTVEDGEAIRRRRQCSGCNARFTTYERIERPSIVVRKRAGHFQAFDMSKLIASITASFPSDDLAAATSLGKEVVEAVSSPGKLFIDSVDLGNGVLQRLRHLDPIAAVRFASVYKNFQSLEDFQGELRQIRKLKP